MPLLSCNDKKGGGIKFIREFEYKDAKEIIKKVFELVKPVVAATSKKLSKYPDRLRNMLS